ncbi:MAG: ABC transporter substrate-binding protein, partial [Paracoccaceae bacterium]
CEGGEMSCKHLSRAGGLLAAAFLGLAVAASAGPADDTLRVAISAKIRNLDFNYSSRREGMIVAELVDESLFHYDPETKEYVPSVASGYVYADPLTVDVTLRGGVKFHDGTLLDAGDVAYTYNWIIDDRSGAKARKSVSRWLKKAERVDDRTVRFHLKSDYPLVLHDIARHVRLRKKGSYTVDGEADRNAMAKEPVGLGPYRVESFEPGREIVLRRHDGYFTDSPKGPAGIGRIVFRILSGKSARRDEASNGALDLMIDVAASEAADLAELPRLERISGPDLRIGFLVLDAAGITDHNGPLTDLLVRRAMNFAIDRARIAETLIGGASEPLYTPCHPAQFGCAQDITKYPYDPAKARELLATAGYPDGFKMNLMVYRNRAIARSVAADLGAIGIRVGLQTVDVDELRDARSFGEVQAYFGTWRSSGIPDVSAILPAHFAEGSDRNMSGDAFLSRTIAAAGRTGDQKKRAKLYRRALATITDQAYWVPLATYSRNHLVSSEVSFAVSADGLPRLYRAGWK